MKNALTNFAALNEWKMETHHSAAQGLNCRVEQIRDDCEDCFS